MWGEMKLGKRIKNKEISWQWLSFNLKGIQEGPLSN